MGKGYRAGRLGEEIRRIVSGMLLKELKDPRFKGMVSVSAVDVTSDGSYATLYITAMNFGPNKELSEEEKEDVLLAFRKSKGRIRSEIGRQVKLRHIPELIFKFDTSMEYGLYMEKIIGKLAIKHDDENMEEQEENRSEDLE
ncbi:30S ribosome-binding factor RbfA [Anaerovorax sp. IOR16]|uniref:30S ribosome-binding factor RbfA n=1 Tax=Anaerovorax sp. IOR16 TaxID=2773458 RepID=UPI0019D02B78|nr:30S ribosome-binding factor RbfA [Anaerovorax sp. IOR16]